MNNPKLPREFYTRSNVLAVARDLRGNLETEGLCEVVEVVVTGHQIAIGGRNFRRAFAERFVGGIDLVQILRGVRAQTQGASCQLTSSARAAKR